MFEEYWIYLYCVDWCVGVSKHKNRASSLEALRTDSACNIVDWHTCTEWVILESMLHTQVLRMHYYKRFLHQRDLTEYACETLRAR